MHDYHAPDQSRRPIVEAALPEAFPAGVAEYVAMLLASLQVQDRRRQDAVTRLGQDHQANQASPDEATRWIQTLPIITGLLALRCMAGMSPDSRDATPRPSACALPGVATHKPR